MATIAKKAVDVERGEVEFTFADGTQRTIEVRALSEDIRNQLVLHGLSQKLGDSYSGAESVADAVEKFNSTADMLLAGDWTSGRSASGGIWVDALAKAGNVERGEALAKWNSLDDETRKVIKASPAVKAAKAAIELERAQAKAEQAGEAGSIDLDTL